MKRYITGIVGVAALGLVSCTSLSEGEDGALGADQNRRVRLRTDGNLRQQMDEQSSDINRKKNIEGRNSKDPATKPPEVRPERLPNSPSDTTRHNKQPPPPKRD